MDLNDLRLIVASYPLPEEVDGIPVVWGGCHEAPMFSVKEDRSAEHAAARWPYPYPLRGPGPMTDQPVSTPLRRSMQEADERIAAAERERDQLRARQETAMQFADQYLAERDQALALLRQVRDTPTYGRALNDIRDLIDSSGLLGEE